MNKNKKINFESVFLWILFFIILSVRLYISFQSNNFGYVGYNSLSQVKYIQQYHTIFKIIYNPLRILNIPLFSPLFYLILALFGSFIKLELIAKIIPNIFASSVIFPTYYLVKEFSKKQTVSYFIALLVSFIPVYFMETVNNVSVYSLSIPLIVLMLYLFLKIENKKHRIIFMILSLFAPFIDKSLFVLVFVFLIYIFLMEIEKMNIKRIERDYSLFFVFWFLWVVFLMYKDVLLIHSYDILKNIFISFPTLESETNILKIILLIGYIPFVNGLYSIYVHLFKIKNKILYLMISLLISTIISSILKIINFNGALILVGVSLSIIFSEFYKNMIYPQKITITKEKNQMKSIVQKINNLMYKYRSAFLIFFYISFILTAIVPSITLSYQMTKSSLTDDELIPFEILSEEEQGKVISMPFEEGAINYLGEKEVFMGNSELFERNLNEKINDLMTVYNSKYETTALEVLTYYNITYIYESQYTKSLFGNLRYVSDDRCFEKIYVGPSNIYKVKCKLRTYR